MAKRTPSCENCLSTGWVAYKVPVALIDGVIHNERIAPCHLCNAGGPWGLGAQQIIDDEDAKP